LKKKHKNTYAKVSHEPISDKILRFRKSERLLHWALALPFLVCLSTAAALFFYYNPDPTRPYRVAVGAIHRVAGIAFIVLPILAIFLGRGDFKTHFSNIREAWTWKLQDIKWLLLMGLAAINKKIVLPEQGKFNAAEKINFIYLMITYPLYIISGFIIWETDAAFVAWNAHFIMALLAVPLVFGHIFMATINSGSRAGLSGMFTGYVDRHWASHHYTRWFREHFGDEKKVVPIGAAKRNRLKCHAADKSPVTKTKNLQGTETFFSESEVNNLMEKINIEKTG
jgi:formate dehydrogenase subunit gamma